MHLCRKERKKNESRGDPVGEGADVNALDVVVVVVSPPGEGDGGDPSGTTGSPDRGPDGGCPSEEEDEGDWGGPSVDD